MPWINREPFERNKKKFQRKRNKQRNKKKSAGNQIAYDEVYNTDKWKKLRVLKLMKNPLCEQCEKEGIVKPALDVHHKIPILKDISKAFDEDNLMSLCRKCHILIHDAMRKQKYDEDEDEQVSKANAAIYKKILGVSDQEIR